MRFQGAASMDGRRKGYHPLHFREAEAPAALLLVTASHPIAAPPWNAANGSYRPICGHWTGLYDLCDSGDERVAMLKICAAACLFVLAAGSLNAQELRSDDRANAATFEQQLSSLKVNLLKQGLSSEGAAIVVDQLRAEQRDLAANSDQLKTLQADVEKAAVALPFDEARFEDALTRLAVVAEKPAVIAHEHTRRMLRLLAPGDKSVVANLIAGNRGMYFAFPWRLLDRKNQ